MLLNRCSASFKGDYINLFSVEETKLIADFIEQQEEEIIRLKSKVREFIHPLDVAELKKYAEFGRLSLTTRAMVCSNNDFIKRGNVCEHHCTNYRFCQKRAELLKGGNISE
jgi:hypothetical protein